MNHTRTATLAVSLLALAVAAIVGYAWVQQSGKKPVPQGVAEVAALAEPTPIDQATTEAEPAAFAFEAPSSDPQTLVELERTRNHLSPPAPERFVGPDGRTHKISYGRSGKALAEEQVRSAKRRLLLAELRADPDAFADAYGINPKEVRWILEGTSDFPDFLLE